jgi:hypothetical protein
MPRLGATAQGAEDVSHESNQGRGETPRARWPTRSAAVITLLITIPLCIWGLLLGLFRPEGAPGVAPFDVPEATFFLSQSTFALVGAVVLVRRPDNRTGWIFCAVAVVASTVSWATQYATQALIVEPGSLPAGDEVAWLTMGPGVLIPVCFALLVAWFPDGRFLSPRWRVLGWMCVIVVVMTVIASVALWPYRGPEMLVANQPEVPGADLANVLMASAFLIVLAVVLGALASIVLRFRSGGPLTRLQLKWFALAASIGVLGLFVGALWERAGVALTSVGSLALPVAAGIAILRYRLFEIDRIINRTIVYALVSGTVVAVYAISVLVIGMISVGPSNQLSVAVATLLAAAAFRPALTRFQGMVDRRFYRRKYDATRTIDSFGARLRTTTDLDELTDDLIGVVGATLQPAHASLWLVESDTR